MTDTLKAVDSPRFVVARGACGDPSVDPSAPATAPIAALEDGTRLGCVRADGLDDDTPAAVGSPEDELEALTRTAP